MALPNKISQLFNHVVLHPGIVVSRLGAQNCFSFTILPLTPPFLFLESWFFFIIFKNCYDIPSGSQYWVIHYYILYEFCRKMCLIDWKLQNETYKLIIDSCVSKSRIATFAQQGIDSWYAWWLEESTNQNNWNEQKIIWRRKLIAS